MEEITRGLIFNCSILLSLALVFFLFTENVTHRSKASRPRRGISSGFLLAGVRLGLSISRRYAERCGGSIEVKTDPSGGNRFEFIFPITTKP